MRAYLLINLCDIHDSLSPSAVTPDYIRKRGSRLYKRHEEVANIVDELMSNRWLVTGHTANRYVATSCEYNDTNKIREFVNNHNISLNIVSIHEHEY